MGSLFPGNRNSQSHQGRKHGRHRSATESDERLGTDQIRTHGDVLGRRGRFHRGGAENRPLHRARRDRARIPQRRIRRAPLGLVHGRRGVHGHPRDRLHRGPGSHPHRRGEPPQRAAVEAGEQASSRPAGLGQRPFLGADQPRRHRRHGTDPHLGGPSGRRHDELGRDRRRRVRLPAAARRPFRGAADTGLAAVAGHVYTARHEGHEAVLRRVLRRPAGTVRGDGRDG